MKNAPSVVFFGSGPVAAESLRQISKFLTIESVVTKHSTVAEMQAVANGAPVYTVADKTELDDLLTSKKFSSRVGILIDFGIIVSQKAIDSFEKGIVNSHFSLLPEWRGADPITFSILSGQKETGVSLMLIDSGMDTGLLLGQSVYEVSSTETTPSLTTALIKLSSSMLEQTIPKWLAGQIVPASQESVTHASSVEPTYSRKLTKSDGTLDFTKPAAQLEREVRAFCGWPKSRTTLAGKDVVVVKATVSRSAGTPGVVHVTDDKKIGVHTTDGTFVIEELKPAGKNTMTAEAFLAGHKNMM